MSDERKRKRVWKHGFAPFLAVIKSNVLRIESAPRYGDGWIERTDARYFLPPRRERSWLLANLCEIAPSGARESWTSAISRRSPTSTVLFHNSRARSRARVERLTCRRAATSWLRALGWETKARECRKVLFIINAGITASVMRRLSFATRLFMVNRENQVSTWEICDIEGKKATTIKIIENWRKLGKVISNFSTIKSRLLR